MKNWTIKPVLPMGIEAPEAASPDLPNPERPSIDEDSGRFASLINMPEVEKEPDAAAGGIMDRSEDARGLHERIDWEAWRRTLSSGEPVDGSQAPNMSDPIARLFGGGAGVQHVDSAVRTEQAAAAEIAARVEITELVSRLVDRIVIEARTSAQPIVEIRFSEEVLPDTVVRLTRSESGLEVALTTLNAEAHNVLNCAAADLGERLAALEGGLPVLITVSMQGAAKSELMFGETPLHSRSRTVEGQRDDRQRKSDHGHS